MSTLDVDGIRMLSIEEERIRVHNEYYKAAVIAENAGRARLDRMCEEISNAKYNENELSLPSKV